MNISWLFCLPQFTRLGQGGGDPETKAQAPTLRHCTPTLLHANTCTLTSVWSRCTLTPTPHALAHNCVRSRAHKCTLMAGLGQEAEPDRMCLLSHLSPAARASAREDPGPREPSGPHRNCPDCTDQRTEARTDCRDECSSKFQRTGSWHRFFLEPRGTGPDLGPSMWLALLRRRRLVRGGHPA